MLITQLNKMETTIKYLSSVPIVKKENDDRLLNGVIVS
jgi:hypothetical protein